MDKYKKIEVSYGSFVTGLLKLHNIDYYHSYNIIINKPKGALYDYDFIQIDNLIFVPDKNITLIVEVKYRNGCPYYFKKWSKKRQAIYLKRHGEPPQQSYWVNTPESYDIYLDGNKQYRELIRQLDRQKEFLLKADEEEFKNATKLSDYEKWYDILHSSTIKYILVVNNLNSGNRYDERVVPFKKIRDIFVLNENARIYLTKRITEDMDSVLMKNLIG